MVSTRWTNGALNTTLSARLLSSSVTPAPWAPGIACAASWATRVSRSCSDSRPIDKPANPANPAARPPGAAGAGLHTAGPTAKSVAGSMNSGTVKRELGSGSCIARGPIAVGT
jgi:hypothetical protein